MLLYAELSRNGRKSFARSNRLLSRVDIEMKRPAPKDSIEPNRISLVVGRVLKKAIEKGEHVSFEKF